MMVRVPDASVEECTVMVHPFDDALAGTAIVSAWRHRDSGDRALPPAAQREAAPLGDQRRQSAGDDRRPKLKPTTIFGRRLRASAAFTPAAAAAAAGTAFTGTAAATAAATLHAQRAALAQHKVGRATPRQHRRAVVKDDPRRQDDRQAYMERSRPRASCIDEPWQKMAHAHDDDGADERGRNRSGLPAVILGEPSARSTEHAAGEGAVWDRLLAVESPASATREKGGARIAQ